MRWRRAFALAVAASIAAPSAWSLTVTAGVRAPVEVGAPATLRVGVKDAVGQVSVMWRFGDGEQTSAGPDTTVTHAYAGPGHYPVIATVRDERQTRSVSFLQTVHYPLTPARPSHSTTIVYDAKRKRVYALNQDSDSVTSIDAERLEKLAEIPTFKTPKSLALAPNGRLWVLHEDDYALAIVDPDRAKLVGAVSLPYASQPTGFAVSPRGDFAYVALRALGKLAKLDARTGEMLAMLDVGPSPHAVAVSHDGERILVSRFISGKEHGELYEIGAASFELTRRFELVADPGPDTDTSGRGIPNYVLSVVIAPDGRRAWTSAKKDNTGRGLARDGQAMTPENSVRSLVAELDLEAGAELLSRRFDVDNRNLPSALEWSEIGDYVFVAAQGNDLVEVLDGFTAAPVSVIAGVGSAPQGLVLAPGGKLFVHAFLSRSVSVFDVSTILEASDFTSRKLADISTVESETLAPDVLLGKQIFYDSDDVRMSREGYLSCASCHLEGFEDSRVFDFTQRGEGLRNTTSLLGKRGTGQGPLHWSANFDEIQDFEHDIRNAFGGQGFMSEDAFNTGTRNQTLGDAKAGSSGELDALSAYVSSLDHVHASPFRNDDGTMTALALEGAKIFAASGCSDCHSGTSFTDSADGGLHDVGTIQPNSGQRLGGPLTGIDTPTLLGVWETAPYLHDGSAETLRDVFTTRNPDDVHGKTSGLSAPEVDALERYLLELDSELPVRTLPVFEPEPEPEPEPEQATEESGCACRSAGASRGSASMAWFAALALAGYAAQRAKKRARRATASSMRGC